jgi:hypothetical protein
MSTTYAAYYNIATSNNSSRKPSSTPSTSSAKSTGSKVMNFLTPRIPMHEPLTPTAVAKKQQREREGGGEREETVYAPARIYDSVLRRPLFQKAKKGNEVTITERRISSSKPSVSSSVDKVYNVHLPGSEYFGMEKK